jgi:hypothetical protein
MADGRNRRDIEFKDMAGDVPRMASMWGRDDMEPPDTVQIGHGPGGRASRSGRLNLRAVSDVLEGYGLDPIEELAKVLTTKEPHRARDGSVLTDPQTGEPILKPVVDMDTRVKLLTELAQYTRPKLKSVEVVNKTPDLTDEQIERRLQSLLERKK